MNIISDFLAFIKKPDDKPLEDRTISQKLLLLGGILILYIACSAIVGIPMNLIYGLYSRIFEGTMKMSPPQQSLLPWGNYFLFFLNVMVLGPFMEELTFRAGITKLNVVKIRLAVSALFSNFVSYSSFRYVMAYISLPQDYWSQMLVYYCFMMILTAIVFLMLTFSRVRFDFLDPCWSKHFPVIFYVMAGLFAFLHFRSYFIWGMPAMLVAGIVLGYTRIRLGLVYSIGLHMIVNSFVVLRTLMAIQVGHGV